MGQNCPTILFLRFSQTKISRMKKLYILAQDLDIQIFILKIFSDKVRQTLLCQVLLFLQTVSRAEPTHPGCSVPTQILRRMLSYECLDDDNPLQSSAELLISRFVSFRMYYVIFYDRNKKQIKQTLSIKFAEKVKTRLN